MLELIRESQTSPPQVRGALKSPLSNATTHLKILDPKRGDQELVRAMAVELDKL